MPRVHGYAKTILPSPVCCQDCFKHTHTHTQTGACTLHPCSVQSPPPCSEQPPSGLVRANPALDSVAPIAAPPLLRVVREMKALGVHYKTTTAAAGDRPPGAASFAFPSFHLQLFLFFMSLNTVTPAIFSTPVLHAHTVTVILLIPEQTDIQENTASKLNEVKYWAMIL